jgi:hypothetical protein
MATYSGTSTVSPNAQGVSSTTSVAEDASNFTSSNASANAVKATNSAAGYGVYAVSSGGGSTSTGFAVYAQTDSGEGAAVYATGASSSTTCNAVYATSGYLGTSNGTVYVANTGAGTGGNAIYATTGGSTAAAVYGTNSGGGNGGYFTSGYTGTGNTNGTLYVSNTGNGNAVYATTAGGSASAVFGNNSGNGHGVYGNSSSATGNGVYANNTTAAGTALYVNAGTGNAIYAISSGTAGTLAAAAYILNGGGHGVYGVSEGGGSYAGVYGTTLGSGYGVYADIGDGAYSLYAYGDIYVRGNINASGSKPFTIDHPLDPENKILRHYAAEGPSPYNVYTGVVVLDAQGAAVVDLPAYFDRINKDHAYSLTPLGAPAPDLHVSSEIVGNAFRISGGRPKQKVAWQVWGVRCDPSVGAIAAEEWKPEGCKGLYLDPEAHGKPEEKAYHRRSQPSPSGRATGAPKRR